MISVRLECDGAGCKRFVPWRDDRSDTRKADAGDASVYQVAFDAGWRIVGVYINAQGSRTASEAWCCPDCLGKLARITPRLAAP